MFCSFYNFEAVAHLFFMFTVLFKSLHYVITLFTFKFNLTIEKLYSHFHFSIYYTLLTAMFILESGFPYCPYCSVVLAG